MSNHNTPTEARRKLLKLLGGGAILLPLGALQGCSGEKETPPAPAMPKADPAPAAKTMPKPTSMPAAEPKPAMPSEPAAADGGLPRLAEDNPMAKSLAYVHDASNVDAAKQSRYAAGQTCKNCALYRDKKGAEWGGCTIFPQNVVSAKGWCSAYVAKPGA